MPSSILITFQSSPNLEAIQYISGILFDTLETPYRVTCYTPDQILESENLVISYGWKQPDVRDAPHLHIAASSLFCPDKYLRTISLPREPVILDGTPYLYPTEDGIKEVSCTSGERVLIVPDVFASAFFFLTRYEEVVQGGPLDARGRFPSTSSWARRYNLLHRPLVNEYKRNLQNWILKLSPHVRFVEPEWEGKPFAVALTRDFDSLSKARKPSIRLLTKNLLRGKIQQGISRFSQDLAIKWLGRSDPHDNLSELIEWEKSLGIRSSLYLMSSNKSGDSNYMLERVSNSSRVKNAIKQGWEVGFHPGLRTSLDEDAFLAEFSDATHYLGPIKGGRQHTLQFRPPYTWRLWERAGLKYDSSLGFADHEGFRCGYCLPFQPFDLIENRRLKIWELPLTIMDNTLDKYRNLDPDQARTILDEIMKAVRQYRGVLVLLWHNTYFGRSNVGAYHDVLAGFIQDTISAGGFVGPALKVISAWEHRFDRKR